MGRIRTIKPDFFTDDQVARLGPLCRLLFIGLWTQADREGRLENRPMRIKAQVLPYDQVEVDTLLGELAAPPGRFVVLYEAEGRPYIQIRTFLEHQRPNVREPRSVIPAPGTTTQGGPRKRISPSASDVVWKGREGKGRERKERDEDVSSAAPAERAPAAATGEDEALLIFPTVRGKRPGTTEWRFTQAVATELREGFPDLDVLAEARRARAWILAKPERRKTSGGMMAFLVGWLGRTQNRGGARTGNAPAARPQPAPTGLCSFHERAESANRPARRPDPACSECRHVAARRRAGAACEPTPVGAIVVEPGAG